MLYNTVFILLNSEGGAIAPTPRKTLHSSLEASLSFFICTENNFVYFKNSPVHFTIHSTCNTNKPGRGQFRSWTGLPTVPHYNICTIINHPCINTVADTNIMPKYSNIDIICNYILKYLSAHMYFFNTNLTITIQTSAIPSTSYRNLFDPRLWYRMPLCQP